MEPSPPYPATGNASICFSRGRRRNRPLPQRHCPPAENSRRPHRPAGASRGVPTRRAMMRFRSAETGSRRPSIEECVAARRPLAISCTRRRPIRGHTMRKAPTYGPEIPADRKPSAREHVVPAMAFVDAEPDRTAGPLPLLRGWRGPVPVASGAAGFRRPYLVSCGSGRDRRPGPLRAPLPSRWDGRGRSMRGLRQPRRTPWRRRPRGSDPPPWGR